LQLDLAPELSENMSDIDLQRNLDEKEILDMGGLPVN